MQGRHNQPSPPPGGLPYEAAKEPCHCRDQGGWVFIVLLLILVLLGSVALYATMRSTTEMQISSNSELNTKAFYAAQAGIEYARTRLPCIREIERANNPPYDPDWNESFISSSTIHYSVHIRHKTETDYGKDLNTDGDLTDIITWGDADGDGSAEQNTTTGEPVEIIDSTGTVGSATARVIAQVRRQIVDLNFAVWGDQSVETKNNGIIWKGESTAPFSANIGSNELLTIKDGSSIYGAASIGRDVNGNAGEYTAKGTILGGGGAVQQIERVEPDPLGMFATSASGNCLLNKEFAWYSSSEHNSNSTGASPPISGNVIDLGNSQTMTLNAGHYYLDSIILRNGALLNIDVSGGPVTLYLDGTLEAKEGSNILLNPAAASTDKFMLYCNAQDTGTASAAISLKNDSDFAGGIYAPRANITVANKGDVRGMLWGSNVQLNNTGKVVFDEDLKKKFLSSKYSLMTWQEMRK